MATNLSAQISITADAAGVETGVTAAKRSLATLGLAGQAAGKQAADGINTIGGAGGAAAASVDAATRNIIRSIERVTVAEQEGGRTSTRYFELLARQKGADPEALKPFLAQLEAAKIAAAATGKAFVGTGVSAAQMANNLRMVGPQVTDIVTSLQGGQNPLTVFIQQGGQLKDIFGGIAPAAKALAGYLASLITPLSVAAAAVAALGYALYKARADSEQLAQSIALTGGAAGLSVAQLETAAKSIAAATSTSIGSTQDTLQALVASGRFSGDTLTIAATAAQNFGRVTGENTDKVVEGFVKAADGVAAYAEEQNRQYHFLTAEQLQYVKTLEDQGRAQEALATVFAAMNGRLVTSAQQVGYVRSVYMDLRDTINELVSAFNKLDTRKNSAVEDRFGQINAEIGGLAGKGATLLQDRINSQRTADLATEKEALTEILRLQQRSIANAAERVQIDESGIKFDKLKEQSLTKQEKMTRELTNAAVLADKAGASAADRERAFANIREKYSDHKSAGPKPTFAAQDALDKAQLALRLADIKDGLDAEVSAYRNAESLLESVRSAGRISDSDYYTSKREFIDLTTAAQVRTLQADNAAIAAEKTRIAERAGREKQTDETRARIAQQQTDLDRQAAANLAKISLLRSDAAARDNATARQEESTLDRRLAGYAAELSAATIAQDAVKRAYDLELSLATLSNSEAGRQSARAQIDAKYRDESARADADLAAKRIAGHGSVTADQQRDYDEQIKLIQNFRTRALAEFDDYYAARRKQEEDGMAGISRSIADYADAASKTGKLTEDAATHALGGLEDAFVTLATTGKLSFKSLADSIIADIARIIAKKQIAALIGDSSGGGSGSNLLGSIVDIASNYFNGGTGITTAGSAENSTGAYIRGRKAAGGPIAAGEPYLVGEKGPEIVIPRAAGTVIPNNALGGSTYAPQTTFHVSGAQSPQETARQIKAMLDERDARNFRSMRYGQLRNA